MLTTPDNKEHQGVAAQVKALISSNGYAPGDRLPPERELIGKLGVSRGTLRRALDTLEREGAIWRHVGKGTFVASHGETLVSSGIPSLSKQITPVRMMQARVCIEAAIAREAALHASGEAIIRMKLAMDRAEAAPSWHDYETQDDLFHRAIAEAADNILLLALFDQLNQVRRAVAWGSVVRSTQRPPRNHSSFAEHRKIAAAIESRDGAAAYDAMRQHIGSVSNRLFEEN